MRLSRDDRLLIAAAVPLLTLAYPPFALGVFPFVCLVPAALLILRGCSDHDPWRRHLHQGFWYGAVTQAVLLYWLGGALWRVHPAAMLLYVVAAVMFGGATAVLFGIVGRIERGSPGRMLIALPAGIVALEWVAEQIGPIAFPWHRVALTVTAHPVLVQSADLVGSAGLGYLIVTVNVSVALAWWTRRRWAIALRHVETGAAVLLLMCVYGLHRITSVPLQPGPVVAVVQPNVALEEKWRPDAADAIVARTLHLTEVAVAEAHPKMVAWPETALPGVLRDHPEWTSRVSRLAAAERISVVTGGQDEAPRADRPTGSSNAVFAVTPSIGSRPAVTHTKQRLVPLVERDLHTFAMTAADAEDLIVHEGPAGRYGSLICFELTFEGLARQLARSGAQVLVTVSNDAWLGRSSGPPQHFAHAVLRAVENRVTVVRSANTGISGIVDPLGRVVARTEADTETYAAAAVSWAETVPPAVRLGGAAGPGALVLLLLLSLAAHDPRARRTSVPAA